ncbi:hypothetical protein [uncultured Brevundimonas sp.]|uniref:hypothetical protein n=1 Tax=uncultured Brevundimonas sp. TaxID=213418 RepID=UPI002621F0E7|nr:hypothetical protein [uncultured Brevundimonas sp.]
MADTPTPTGGLAEAVRHLAPYAPVMGGAMLSMAFGERLTIRGKVLSAGAGLLMALFVAPFVVDIITAVWPWGDAPASLAPVIGFGCGAFGMTILSGLMQALAKYSKDPLSLVRVQIGGVIITGGARDPDGAGR